MSPNHANKKDITIQLEQKIIHFRSEMATYKQKLLNAERELKKEKIRNEYLQKKLYENDHMTIKPLKKEIHRLNQEILSLEVALEEEQERSKALQLADLPNHDSPKQITQNVMDLQPSCQTFFNYAIWLAEYALEEEKVIIFGSFIIENNGKTPLHDLVVCIRLEPHHAGKLSGKISISPEAHENTLYEAAEQWQFAHEKWREKIRESGEYWIKPTSKKELLPNEQLIFSNFEISLQKPANTHSIIVEGFAYCHELPKGITANNRIIINF